MVKKIIFLLLIQFFFWANQSIYATCNEGKCDSMDEYEAYIQELTSKKEQLSKSKNTLANQIKIIDSQVQLTLLKITQTENSIKTLETEIESLSTEIGKLDVQLNDLSVIYINQIVQNYKLQKRVPGFAYIVSSNLNDFLEQRKYITTLQNNSQNSLLNMETVRTNYDIQKTTKEKKQTELETLQKTLISQKSSLDSQKFSKNKLLEITKNDEKTYDNMLEKARSEYEAINSILAGKGIETKVGTVKQGERIASIITGPSCSSSGTHLHFMVTKNDVVQNPFNYLKSIDYINCSGSSCGSSNSDSFNPSGNWDWPISPQIKFNQGYGVTWSVQYTWVRSIYSFHNGIDIAGNSTTVTTPIAGELFRGSYFIKSRNCYLRYVRVAGSDGISILNLHINY